MGGKTRNIAIQCYKTSCTFFVAPFSVPSGSDDGNENVIKAIGLTSKTTALHVHHTFFYISLPSLHDHDVKMLNFMFYRARKQAATKFSFLCLNLDEALRNSTPGEFACIRQSKREFTF